MVDGTESCIVDEGWPVNVDEVVSVLDSASVFEGVCSFVVFVSSADEKSASIVDDAEPAKDEEESVFKGCCVVNDARSTVDEAWSVAKDDCSVVDGEEIAVELVNSSGIFIAVLEMES